MAWGQRGIPADFCFDQLPGHMDEQLMPVLESAMARVPVLQEAGWRSFFCGPESFTPDDQFHVGPVPGKHGYFVAAGLNSVGSQSAGGLGKACAEWMHHGHSPLDLWSNDIRRMYPFMGTQTFLEERVTESLGLLYDNHFPFRQFETARNVRLSPIHQRLVEPLLGIELSDAAFPFGTSRMAEIGYAPLEAGVGFVCALDKPGGFIGRDAIAAQKAPGSHLRKRLVQFVLEDPEWLPWHHEPILDGDAVLGYLTSGGYGHTLGASVGLGYVKSLEPIDQARLDAGRWSIDIGGERYRAKAFLRAAFDPKGERLRAGGESA